MKFMATAAAAALSLAFMTLPAHATVLVDELNNPDGFSEALTFNITATSTSTLISVSGYNLPGEDDASLLSFALGAGPNLLGAWTFTPASVGSSATTYFDGTSVDALAFLGFGSGDTFSQAVATAVGQTYTLSFLHESFEGTPNAFHVDVSDGALSGAPEPGVWALMALGMFGLGAALRRRTRTAIA